MFNAKKTTLHGLSIAWNDSFSHSTYGAEEPTVTLNLSWSESHADFNSLINLMRALITEEANEESLNELSIAMLVVQLF